MKKTNLLFLPVLMVAFCNSMAIAQDDVLENEDVVRLLQLGFEEDMVLSLIESRKSDFDFSGSGLSDLIDAGVSGNVLSAMIEAEQRRLHRDVNESQQERVEEASPQGILAGISEPLTNTDIVRLVEEEIDESVIIDLIRELETDFDRSISSLESLAESGVSINIITEMMFVGETDRLRDENIDDEETVDEEAHMRRTGDEEPGGYSARGGFPFGGISGWGAGIESSELSYHYVEGGLAFFPGYGLWDEIEEDMIGLHFRGVNAFTDELFLRGGLRYLTDNLDFTWLDIGLGYRFMYSGNWEFYAGGGIDYIDVSGNVEIMGMQLDVSGDDIGVRFFSGTRYMVDETWELGSELSWGTVEPPHAANFYRITGNVIYAMTEQVGILGEIGIENGSPGFLGGARWAF